MLLFQPLDNQLIICHSKSVSAYFGDLKDGIHKGDENDPRVSIIQVVPDEIRYWVATKGTVGRAMETAASAITGKTAVPGELRTITMEEVRSPRYLYLYARLLRPPRLR
jgi:hypothetical protein